jgi:hypothetical protein
MRVYPLMEVCFECLLWTQLIQLGKRDDISVVAAKCVRLEKGKT